MATDTMRGKVALVTGAASGLGEATVNAFAEEKCGVACVDVNRAALDRVCATLRDRDVPCLALPCDVSDADAVFAAVERAARELSRLDVVVNNAAIDHTVSVEEMSVAQWDQVLAVNLRAPFLFAKAALPIMRRQGGGHIINIASTAATRAWANCSAYHASKWGVIGFSRGLGVEGRAANVRVTTIIPGGMRTHFFDRFSEQGIPLPEAHNLQDPANVARAIVFAVQMPDNSVVQELMVTPLTETSWP